MQRPQLRGRWLNALTPDQVFEKTHDWTFWARDDQLAPPQADEGGEDWFTWLVLGGRGAGKTRTGAEWIRALAETGAVGRMALVGETYEDAREVMIDGESGLRAIAPEAMRPTYEASRHRLIWPNGAQAHVFSAEDPDGLRGHQFEAAWSDELGCGAIDKAANQPNVFYDPKSAESALPYFSSGHRDDFIQRRFLEAHLTWWQQAANNPVSPLYGGPMVDTDNIHLYTWDARPYPDFPARADVWADAENWPVGHWLQGRTGRVPLALLVSTIAARTGFDALDTSALQGLVTGYVIDRPMSPREALEPLAGLYRFDAVESGNTLRFVPRGQGPVATLDPDDFVAEEEGAYSLVTAQAGDLPAALELTFIDEGQDFGMAVAGARQPDAIGRLTVSLDVPVVMDTAEAEGHARALLADALAMGRQASFTLPPDRLALEPTDVVTLALPDGAQTFRLTEITDADAREVQAVATTGSDTRVDTAAPRRRTDGAPARFGPPVFELMDLPLLDDGEVTALYAAAFASPWPGGAAIWREMPGGGTSLEAVLGAPATIGRLSAPLGAGPSWRWDRASSLRVRLSAGTLMSVDETDVLAGANLAAVRALTGEWELLRFASAVLQPDGSWLLSGLLRGLAGTELEAAAGAPDGARFVLLNEAVEAFSLPADARGLAVTRRIGPRGQAPEGSAFITDETAPDGLGWRPLSPVQPAARRDGSDIALTWLRRTRIGGDSWQGEVVPLAEEAERYDIEIFDGATRLRTLMATAPEATYSAQMIAEDFPGGGTATIRIAQRSALFGPGRAVEISLSLPA